MIESKVSLAILLASFAIFAQISDAEEKQPTSEPHVYRDKVDAHWFADEKGSQHRFWYRLDLPGKCREFILVDALKRTRAPAFDHIQVATALTKLLGKGVTADALPIDSLSFAPDGKTVTLHGEDQDWKLEFDSHTISPVEKTPGDENYLQVQKMPVRSKASERETSIRFVNKQNKEVDLFWLDGDGERKAYGSIPAGKQRNQHTFSGHAWLIAAKDGSPIAAFHAQDDGGIAVIESHLQPEKAKSKDSPTRSPDGKWEVSVRGDNLFLRSVNDRQKQQLTYDASPADSYRTNNEASRSIEMEDDDESSHPSIPEVYWAPDSHHFVAMRNTLGSQRMISIVESSPKDQLQPRLHSIPYLKPGDDVPYSKPHLFSIESKHEIPIDDALFRNPWSIGDVRWNPDSSEFSFLFNQRGHQALRVLGIAKTGAVRTIVDEASKTFICYSSKFFCNYQDESAEIIWMSERDGWNHLYLYDAKTGKVKNQITRGQWVVRSVDRIDGKKRQIWFQASGGNRGENIYQLQYYRINFDGSGLTPLTHGNGTHSIEYSPDQRFFIDTWSRVDQPPVNELIRSEDGAPVCKLEEADVSELAAANWKMLEPFVAKGRDGQTDIYGVICRPIDFDASKRYPIIEDIYAGPQDSFVPISFRARPRYQDLADCGYIVVAIDGMGTSNRSKAFHDVCWKKMEDAGFPDRIAWIKAAAVKYPSMDLGRVGLYGTSAGGQSALRGLLDHGDFYKAGVADCGCHDNRMDKIWWNEQWLGWPLDESYVRGSNVVDAHKLTGKLLLMVGEMDTNVDPASTTQVANALVKAGKDFELMVIPGAGHGVMRTEFGTRKQREFFARAFQK